VGRDDDRRRLNGAKQPAGFSDRSTGEGSTAMGFYNVLQGDAPYFKSLADQYAMSDNFHQSIQGGTGANHVALGTGDAVWSQRRQRQRDRAASAQHREPRSAANTNNWYAQDGYSGGTYSDCSDDEQPGVAAVNGYLKSQHVKPNCDKGHYYLLNNYSPGYYGDGSVNSDQFAIPPSSVRTIGDELVERDISWRYYGDDWNRYVADPDFNSPDNEYCDICNPFAYSASIMTNAKVRTTHLKDTTDLYDDVAGGLAAGRLDHQAERSARRPPGLVQARPLRGLHQEDRRPIKAPSGAVEGHGHLRHLRRGRRLLRLGLRPAGRLLRRRHAHPADRRLALRTGGHISHEYGDHVSILKFIERNWGLDPITGRSRDNLPNPITSRDNPYAPVNGPALGDLHRPPRSRRARRFFYARRRARGHRRPGKRVARVVASR
jgi:phospholipase C